MKAAIVILLSLAVLPLYAATLTHDAVAIQVATGATDIRTIRNGFIIQTPAGTRTVYRSRNGYYIEGRGDAPSQQIIKTRNGYRVESSSVRGAVFNSRLR